MDQRTALAARVLALVDLTDLGEHCTPEAIDVLCARADGPFGRTAAVCVWPDFVAQAASLLRHTGVAVATVVNFPGGGDDIDATVAEAGRALTDGADEIDMVLPYHSFLAGNLDVATRMVLAVRTVIAHPRRLKVILETGSYPDQGSVAAATRLAIDNGTDFVKTSTGKSSVSATPQAAETMLYEIRSSGRSVGLKPSGGIRTLDDAAVYLELADRVMGAGWATAGTFRFGASGLLDALESVLGGATEDLPDTTY
jgi:deoxyribose-phosphate aldolase